MIFILYPFPFTITAPTGVPQNVAAVAVSSSSIRFTWAAPFPEEQNGIIRAYNITITERETEIILFYETEGTATLLIVNSLHPFYSYRCSIAAVTVALGPAAVVDVQTLPEGTYQTVFILLYRKSLLLQYVPQLLVVYHRIVV